MVSYLPTYSPAIPMGDHSHEQKVDTNHLPIYPSCFFYTPYAGQAPHVTGKNPFRVSNSPETNLFVYNIPSTYSDEDLFRLFEKFGTLLSAKVRGCFDSQRRWFATTSVGIVEGLVSLTFQRKAKPKQRSAK